MVTSTGFDREYDTCRFPKLKTMRVVMYLQSIIPNLHNTSNVYIPCKRKASSFLCQLFKTKKVVDKTQVFELTSEIPLASNYQLFLSSKEKIINVENQYQRLVLHNLKVHVWNNFTLKESQLKVPSSSRTSSQTSFFIIYYHFIFHTYYLAASS